MSAAMSVRGLASSSWRDLWQVITDRLERAGVAGAQAEARWILQEVSGLDLLDREVIGAKPTDRARQRVDELVARRLGGEPLQYVLGSWAFCGLDLLVDRRVLIPRPETEVTATVAIGEAVRLGARRGRANPLRGPSTEHTVVDLGTGSGAIAIAIAAALGDVEIWATDVSADALDVARANLAGAGSIASRVHLARGSWFDALGAELRGRMHVVVSNPPYVAASELAGLAPEVAQHEPHGALVAGPTGLEMIEDLLGVAPRWLVPGGAFVCELAPHQADRAVELATGSGFAHARIERDLAGRDRVLVATTPDHPT